MKKDGGDGGQGFLGSEEGVSCAEGVNDQRFLLSAPPRLRFASPGCDTISCLTQVPSSSALPSHAQKTLLIFLIYL